MTHAFFPGLTSRLLAAALLLPLSAPPVFGADAASEIIVSRTESPVDSTGESVVPGSAADPAGEPAVHSDAEVPEESPAGAEDVSLRNIRFAKDYAEIWDELNKGDDYYMRNYSVVDGVDFNNAVIYEDAEEAAPAFSEKSQSADSPYHTDTNLRTENVDEADVVKTDGHFIYMLKDHSTIEVIEADNGRQKIADIGEPVSICPPPENPGRDGAREFFVNGSLLHVICQNPAEMENKPNSPGIWWNESTTTVLTYDVSDLSDPKLVGKMTQDGSYREARFAGGILYLFTDWQSCLSETEEESVYIPRVAGNMLAPGQICIPDSVVDTDFLVISAIDPAAPDQAADCTALLSVSGRLYVSADSIYALTDYYDYSRFSRYSGNMKTEIVKFRYGDGKIDGQAAAVLRGSVHDSFALDEYNGYLRVLTTYEGSVMGDFIEAVSSLFGVYTYRDSVRHNALFILDKNLKPAGRLTDLAPGEEIKSARFFGDTAFFVTFRNTDPLFSADLSDPARPKIIGSLSLPGFSAYLHPIGDGLLLGMGYDADPQTGAITGIKLSLFDISDPANVKETDKYVVPGVTYCPALENYKAVYVDEQDKCIGFFLSDRFLVYRFVEGCGFFPVCIYDLFKDNLQGSVTPGDVRGLRIGSTFYVAGGSFLAACDIDDDYTCVETAVLDTDINSFGSEEDNTLDE